MPPKRRACSCKEHANFSTGQDFIVHRINARVFKKKTVQHLIDRSYIMKHSTFLCTSCAAFAEKNFEDETPSKRHKLDINDVMDNLQFMDDEELSRIAFKISQLQQLNIKNDIRQNLSNSYKDDVFLSTFNVNDWVSNRNRILNSFVSGLSGGNENIQTQALIVDLLYYYVSSRYISPIYFAKNLMIYFTTGSKAAVDIFSDEFPSGCYKTILNWIDQHAENKNECPPDVDVATYFDNNQVLEKKWNVTENYTANCSVITNLIHIIPSCVSKIQYNKELSPTYWRYIGVNNREKMALELAHQIKKTNILFRQHRDEFINVRMKKVLSEQKFKSQRYTDYIDENAACPEHVAASERYTFVDSKHPATSVTCVVGEPCYENPCSYESIQMVFDHILDITVGEDKRQWSVIGCDALPYTLGSRLIENIFSCECQEDFNSQELFESHRLNCHRCSGTAQDNRKYNRLLLLPGLGHYEINMIKAIFRLLWPICFIELANLLGFNSSRAQAACQNASDHHKSWQIFEIFLFATTEELLLPYVRQNLSSGSSPSVQGYHSWLAGVVDPNYKFMAEIVFSCSFALHLFRAGVRRNNSAVIQCAKNKFACLFFGLGMPNYMETYIRDSFVRLQCPAPVLAFIEDNESYSISGSPNKGEGGDFILENVNRRIKMCIPPGLPDKRRWKNACRNVDRLQKIKDHLHKSSAHTSYEFSYNISQEISSFRSALRSKNYFHTPFIYKEHTSLSGNVLDSQLVNIRNTCNSNFDTFLQHIIINGIHSRKKLNTIIITHEDRNNHKLKTKAELITLIQHKLNSCTSQEIQCKWSYIKRSNKGKLLQFLEEILIMEEGDEATEAEDS